MDCNNARLLLEFARPVSGELDKVEAAALKEHLHQCPDCAPLALAEQQFDEAIGQAMKNVPIPDGLRTRLLTKLDRARDAWYRRFLVRRVLPVGAAAAAVLLVVFLGLRWNETKPTVVNVNQTQEELEKKYQARREQVDEWLHSVAGEENAAPKRFDYHKLDRFFMSALENQQVPTLVFLRGDGSFGHAAWVYVLNNKRFDVDKLKNHKVPDSGTPGSVRVKVLSPQHHDNPNVTYLVFYTGTELNPFFDTK